MTFPTELERLPKEATEGPWEYGGMMGDPGEPLRHFVKAKDKLFVLLSESFSADYSGLDVDLKLSALLRNHADAILGLVRAAERMSRALDTGERNEDGTQRGVRVPEKHHVDDLRNELAKLNGGKG